MNGERADAAAVEQPLTRWLLVLAVVVVAFAAIGVPAHATYGARVTADEPQYLLTALSLGRQLDLDISDEIAGEQYRPFHKVDLDRQTAVLDDGRELSPHDPLLPLLLAVPMRFGGWVAAKAFLVALASGLAVLTAWLAVRRFAVRPVVALPVVAVFFCTPPLSTYASQVYPEIAAALALTAAVAVTSSMITTRHALAFVVSVSALPWLSVKYVPVAAMVALLGLYRCRDSRRTLIALVGALAAMGLAYVVAHRLLYGGWTVYVSGDYFAEVGESGVIGTSPNYVGRSRRALGLLVDRGFGLGAWSPAWLLAPLAFAALFRARMPQRWRLGLPVAAGWFVATFVASTMHGWWWPGRQVVVVLPLVVIAIAWVVDRVRSLVVPIAVMAALAVVTWCWTAFDAASRRHTLVVDFEETANPWYRLWRLALPDGRSVGTGADVRTALWWMAMLASVLVGVLLARRLHGEPPGGRPLPKQPSRDHHAESRPVPAASRLDKAPLGNL